MKYGKREKQISVVLDNLSGMRGEIEGIVGQKQLPQIDPLMLESMQENDGAPPGLTPENCTIVY